MLLSDWGGGTGALSVHLVQNFIYKNKKYLIFYLEATDVNIVDVFCTEYCFSKWGFSCRFIQYWAVLPLCQGPCLYKVSWAVCDFMTHSWKNWSQFLASIECLCLISLFVRKRPAYLHMIQFLHIFDYHSCIIIMYLLSLLEAVM